MVEQKQINYIDARDFLTRVARLFEPYTVNFEYTPDFENLGISTFMAEIPRNQTRIIYEKWDTGKVALTIAKFNSEMLVVELDELRRINIDCLCNDGRKAVKSLQGMPYGENEYKHGLFVVLASYLAQNRDKLGLEPRK